MLQRLKHPLKHTGAGDPLDAAGQGGPVKLSPAHAFSHANVSRWPDQARRISALAVAVVAHAGLLYVLTAAPSNNRAGSGGRTQDAISITLVNTHVLESREQKNMAGRAASGPVSAAASVSASQSLDQVASASKTGSKMHSMVEAPMRIQTAAISSPKKKLEKQPPAGMKLPRAVKDANPEKPDAYTPQQDLAVSSIEMPDPAKPGSLSVVATHTLLAATRIPETSAYSDALIMKSSQTNRQKAFGRTKTAQSQLDPVRTSDRTGGRKGEALMGPQHEPDKQRQRPSKALSVQNSTASAFSLARMGGVSARSQIAAEQVLGARAAASPGVKNKYAALIGKTLRMGIPPVRHRRGINRKLVVMFAIESTGALRYVRVSRSSGRRRLDRAIMRALKNIDFPTPPPDMTQEERTYTLPFYFN